MKLEEESKDAQPSDLEKGSGPSSEDEHSRDSDTEVVGRIVPIPFDEDGSDEAIVPDPKDEDGSDEAIVPDPKDEDGSDGSPENPERQDCDVISGPVRIERITAFDVWTTKGGARVVDDSGNVINIPWKHLKTVRESIDGGRGCVIYSNPHDRTWSVAYLEACPETARILFQVEEVPGGLLLKSEDTTIELRGSMVAEMVGALAEVLKSMPSSPEMESSGVVQ